MMRIIVILGEAGCLWRVHPGAALGKRCMPRLTPAPVLCLPQGWPLPPAHSRPALGKACAVIAWAIPASSTVSPCLMPPRPWRSATSTLQSTAQPTSGWVNCLRWQLSAVTLAVVQLRGQMCRHAYQPCSLPCPFNPTPCLQRTAAGGGYQTWLPKGTTALLASLNAVAVVPGSLTEAWAVGATGRYTGAGADTTLIVKTSDAGLTWTTLDTTAMPYDKVMRAVVPVNSTHIYAFGVGG